MTFFTGDTQVSRAKIFVHHFEFSPKTADLAAQQHLSCAHGHDLPQGEDLAPFFLQEIHRLSTKTL